jgi:hypothetical protein
MGQDIFSITLSEAEQQLGPAQTERDEKGRLDGKWNCGCEFHATDRQGGGILFACEEHADKD